MLGSVSSALVMAHPPGIGAEREGKGKRERREEKQYLNNNKKNTRRLSVDNEKLLKQEEEI